MKDLPYRTTNKSNARVSSSTDFLELLRLTRRSSLKSYATHKKLSRDTRSIPVTSLLLKASGLYLEIYGLLAGALTLDERRTNLRNLPDTSDSEKTCSDKERLQKAVFSDSYALDLLRLLITRLDDNELRYPLSSKVASLQIVHDRMKELQK